MKSSLMQWARPLVVVARRWLWLITWLLWLPMAVYIPWFNQGHSLWPLQLALLVISVVGLVVINAETAAAPALGKSSIGAAAAGSGPGR